MNPNLPTDETFSEGSDLPPTPTMPAPPMEDCVKLQSLALPNEGERLESPAVGDRVNYQVEGTITRIEGDKAYIKKASVNGQPEEPDADDAGGPSDNDADNLDRLSADAQTMSTEESF